MKNEEGTVNGEQECSGEHKNPQGTSRVALLMLRRAIIEISHAFTDASRSEHLM